MAAGKCGAFQNAVDGYIDNIRDVVDELNSFGDTAVQVVQGGITDGADINIFNLAKTDGQQNWEFLADIETALRNFFVCNSQTAFYQFWFLI